MSNFLNANYTNGVLYITITNLYTNELFENIKIGNFIYKINILRNVKFQ